MCETIFLVTVKRLDRGVRVTVYFSLSMITEPASVVSVRCCRVLLLFWFVGCRGKFVLMFIFYSVWLYSPYYVILVYLIRLTKSERRQRKQFVMHYFLWIWLGIWPHWPSFVDPRVLREWVEAFVLKISKVYTRQIVCWSLCVLNGFHFHKPIPAHNTLARAFLLCLCINRCTCISLTQFYKD